MNKREEIIQVHADGQLRRYIEWQVASKRSKIKQVPVGGF